MAPPSDSSNTDLLELKSLQLDVQTLQQQRAADRQEFIEFTHSVNQNFANLQSSFSKVQSSLDRFFSEQPNLGKRLVTEGPPGTPEVLPANREVGISPGQDSINQAAPKVHGLVTTVVPDHTIKDNPADATVRHPYRHPHYGQQQQLVVQSQKQDNQVYLSEEEGGEQGTKHIRNRSSSPHDTRRGLVSVKPTKLNIPEFSGDDTEHWIQTIEQYFDTSRTPLEQRTEIAVSYLKGTAVQWWRGTGFHANTLPWHRFCRYIGDRFAESSICDNVKQFHALSQSGTVGQYIEQFERSLNLMRRDNPGLPDDYYTNSFVAGLSDYIQAHLQCSKPKTCKMLCGWPEGWNRQLISKNLLSPHFQ